MFKKLFTLFILLSFIIIGFAHNSMMAFAMQDWMKMQMVWEISMDCCDSNKDKNEKECCFTTDVESNLNNLNNSNKTLKIKLIGFIDIISLSSHFLENKKLIKNYTSLTGIIKNNC